jgi:acetamidase/formamidase
MAATLRFQVIKNTVIASPHAIVPTADAQHGYYPPPEAYAICSVAGDLKIARR